MWPRRWHQTALLLLMLPMAAFSWTSQTTTSDEVQLWTDDAADRPYLLVRAEVTIDASLLRLLVLLQDANSQHQWLPYTHQVEVLARPAPGQTLVRFETESRWPFVARDAITLFVVSQPDPATLRIDMLNQPDAVPASRHVERIPQAEGYWLLAAQPDCRTRVTYEAGSRWGGNVPQWLVNRMNLRIARSALQNLQQWAPAQTATMPPTHLYKVPLHADCV